jgi:hypothetical protein
MLGCLYLIVNNISDVSSRKAAKARREEEEGRVTSFTSFFFSSPLAALRETS